MFCYYSLLCIWDSVAIMSNETNYVFSVDFTLAKNTHRVSFSSISRDVLNLILRWLLFLFFRCFAGCLFLLLLWFDGVDAHFFPCVRNISVVFGVFFCEIQSIDCFWQKKEDISHFVYIHFVFSPTQDKIWQRRRRWLQGKKRIWKKKSFGNMSQVWLRFNGPNIDVPVSMQK